MAAALMQSETRDDSAKTDDKNKTASGKEGKHYAGTDGKSYPITDPIDVYNAAHAIGRDTKGDADREKVKANIIRIAYELGPKYVAQLPEDWKHKADQKTDAARSAAATEKYWEQRDAEEQAELIAYTAIKGLLTDIAGHLASAQAAADSLIANETHDPADGGSQAEADEEAIETAQLRSLYVLCNQIASAANGIAGLVQGELCYDPVMYRSAQIADADRTRRLALESAKAAR